MTSRSHASAACLLAAAVLATGCVDQPDAVAPGASRQAAVGVPSSAMLTSATSVVVGPYTITITDLGLLPGGTYSSGYSLNNTGLVAGMATNVSGGLERVLWSNGALATIPNFDPSSTLLPAKLNDRGDLILNEAFGKSSVHVAIWRDPGGAYHQLPPFPGGDALRVYARGINGVGLITGTVREPNLAVTLHGVLWQDGAFLQDLGAMSGYQSTDPQDINDLGQVVGIATNTTNFNTTAFRWQNGSFTNLGALAPGAASSALATNNTGTIVGTSNGGFPVRWVNGQIQSLPVPAGVIQPTPVDVNDNGDIIGWGTSMTPGALYASAFWRNGQPILLPPWPGATQTMARSINNRAEITGEGNIVAGGPMHALMWSIAAGSPSPVNATPVVSLVATSGTTIRAGGRVTMRGSFTDPDNGPWRYEFHWGNAVTTGTANAAGSMTATRTYSTRGTFSVRYSVTDGKGAIGTSKAVKVTVR